MRRNERVAAGRIAEVCHKTGRFGPRGGLCDGLDSPRDALLGAAVDDPHGCACGRKACGGRKADASGRCADEAVLPERLICMGIP